MFGQAVLHSNVDIDTQRAIGQDLIEIAGEITCQPQKVDTMHKNKDRALS